MGVLDYLLLALIAVGLVNAVVRSRKRPCAGNCAGCTVACKRKKK